MNVNLAGDTLLLVEFAAGIDPLLNARVVELGRLVSVHGIPGVRDVVPGYASLGIHFDPLRTDLAALERVVRAEAERVAALETLPEARLIEIAVRYGGIDGPDLDDVARFARCSRDDVVAQHAAVTYRVYMLGFVPGFAYLGRVPTAIAAPRRSVPRDRVPAGSVGIAGQQTGVYPIATPGGWQLIGRTEVVLFDASREPAALLAPGDLVRFVPQ